MLLELGEGEIRYVSTKNNVSPLLGIGPTYLMTLDPILMFRFYERYEKFKEGTIDKQQKWFGVGIWLYGGQGEGDWV